MSMLRGNFGTLVWAAAAVVLVWCGASMASRAYFHRGPGVVVVGDGERTAEREVMVKESAFRRHGLVSGGILTCCGLLVMGIIARGVVRDRSFIRVHAHTEQ